MCYPISIAAILNVLSKLKTDLAYFAPKYISSILDPLAVEMRRRTIYKYIHNTTNVFEELEHFR